MKLLQLRTRTAETGVLRLGKFGVVVIVGASKMDMCASTFSRFEGEHLRSRTIIELSTLPFGHEQKRRHMDIRVDEGNACRVSYYAPLFHYAMTESVWNRSTVARYLDGLGFSAAARWLLEFIIPAVPQSFTVPLAAGVVVPATGSQKLRRCLVVLSNRLTPKTMKTQVSLKRISPTAFWLKHSDGCIVKGRRIGPEDAERYLEVWGFNPRLIDLAFQ